MSVDTKFKGRRGQAEFVRWMGPLLDVLRELGGSAAPREASDGIAALLRISDDVRNEVTKSGQERFHNQVQWARQYLAWEGYIDSSKRGVWALTPFGREKTLDEKESRAIFLKQVERHAALRKAAKVAGSADDSDDSADSTATTPAEPSRSKQFIDLLKSLSPSGFENLCKRLLRESGFEKVEVTGRSGDGGIDGIGVLQINPLVSFNVVFQCKKWDQAVPPKEVRDLHGAMDGRAEKGILLTTGTFSTQARREAERPGATPIELVDGEKLYEMFKRFELGLTPTTV
jgi:restriction system protein